jgi:hypothetical protein
LYVRKGDKCFIFLWVDDLIIVAHDAAIEPLVSAILKRFDGRDLGPATWVLGMEIIRDRAARQITVTQRRMVQNVLEKFGFAAVKTAAAPLDAGAKLDMSEEKLAADRASPANHQRFMQVVGAFQHLACVTRPDIAFAASSLAKFMASSANEHWSAVKHVLRYLQLTKSYGLVFGLQPQKPLLEAYTDADFANQPKAKSVSGMLVYMFGDPVVWRSKRQSIIARSSCESEIIAMSDTAKELMWTTKLVVDLGLGGAIPILWGDNQSANTLAKDPIASDRSKHIRTRHLSIQEHVELEECIIKWVGTDDQLADVLTKSLAGPAHRKFRDKLHVRPVPEEQPEQGEQQPKKPRQQQPK